MRNLLEVVDVVATEHGAHCLTSMEYGTSDSSGTDARENVVATQLTYMSLTPRDCKEAPQNTPCSGERKGKGFFRKDDSVGWYSYCDTEDCFHDGGRSSSQ